MQNTTETQYAESDIIQIKEINEDAYWAKKYGIPAEYQKNMDYDTGIYDKIIEAYLAGQNTAQ